MTQSETHIRFELEIDSVQVSRLEDLLDRLSVERWLVLPGQSGRTPEGRWNRTGQIAPSGRRVLAVLTLTQDEADRISSELHTTLEQLHGDIIAFPVSARFG
ncbi:hypothetical protein [Maricaulis parjimensis]|uniref:hypothetical protein n=1 Tax=Maricaulis parjimensis TaxID=144023 RepID=UPI00193A6AC5|nr:hypothetical protein [Maricaulis parjimensis]